MADTIFSGLLGVTGRKAELAAQTEASNQGLDYWARAGGMAGLGLRQSLLDQGIGMSPQDKRALATQQVMQTSQQTQAKLLKEGASPLEAQYSALTEAMSAFMAVGDFESAQKLTEPLGALQKQMMEMDKLRSESYKNTAAGDKSAIQAEIEVLKERRAQAKSPYEIAKLEAEIAAKEAQARKEDALARKADRWTPTSGKDTTKAKSGRDMFGTSAHNEAMAGFGAAFQLYDTMEELSRMYDTSASAAAASAGGQALNTVGQYFSGFNTLLGSRGGQAPSDWASQETREGGETVGAMVAKRNKKISNAAGRLGIDATVMRSLVVNAAYALARAADPGGRLSNNDFDYALEQLGAVQDPASAQAAFASIAERAYKLQYNRLKGMGLSSAREAYGEQMDMLEEARTKFTTERGVGPYQDAPAASPAQPGRPSLSDIFGTPGSK